MPPVPMLRPGPTLPPGPTRHPTSPALRAVLEPLPRYLADALAFVVRRDLPCLVKVGRRQQAVGEQEIGEIAGVTALFPDEALQQLLVVRYRSLAAQVQGDH